MAILNKMNFAGFLEKIGLSKKRSLSFPELFDHFKQLIAENNKSLEIMADMGEKLSGEFVFDQNYITTSTTAIADSVSRMIYHLDCIAPRTFRGLFPVCSRIRHELESELKGHLVIPEGDFVICYDAIDDTLETLVGGKNAHLGIISNILELKIPAGFAITSRCFDILVRKGLIAEQINGILYEWEKETIDTSEASEKITQLIHALTLPKEIRKAIEQGVDRITEKSDASPVTNFAVRSSGIGEDSEHSYAGQYTSILNINSRAVPEAYKRVLASLYSPRAMEYRRTKGIKESEAVMAVGCQKMIPAKISGVIYTLDVFDLKKNCLLITALPGLGANLVGGKQQADRYVVSRTPPYAITGMEIVHKKEILQMGSLGQGVITQPLAPELRDRPSLRLEQVHKIVETALALENYSRHPQDIEFAIDQNDELVILQARPLNIYESGPKMVCDLSALEDNFPVLMKNKGEIVQEGVAMGIVFKVTKESDLEKIPKGTILVAHFSSPNLAQAIRKVNGIITDVGSPIGHLSTISREFRIPMIINCADATKILEDGQEITLDALDNRVFAGFNTELCHYELAEETFEETYEFRLLRRLFKKISPLKLVDPEDKNFTPESCTTLHDLIRYVHEQSVNVLISKNYIHDSHLKDYSKQLKIDIPLDLTIIDFAVCDLVKKKTITLEEIECPPLKTFVEGMCAPGLWAKDPVDIDLRSFMSSMTRTFSSDVADPSFVGQNLAVASGNYANISLRLGYHFSMIDTIASPRNDDNYVYFRFFGGVTDKTRRSRRAQFIQTILSTNDFMTKTKGDLIVGRIKGTDKDDTLKKIFILGGLVSFTRQLDVKMINDNSIIEFTKEFQRILADIGHTGAT